MPIASRTSGRTARGNGSGWTVLACLAVAVAVAVGFPAVMVLAGIATGAWKEGAGAALEAAALDGDARVLLLRTVRTALLIGVLATALAWPVAWALRLKRAAWAPLLVAPMLMPAYLAYAGWGLLRSPGTWSGDLLASAPPPPWSAEPGYWPLLAGRVLAVMGLSLWAWPVAAVILAAGAARIDGAVLEALRMEHGSEWRKRLSIAGMMRIPAAGAVAAVALVMLGSAVPLHLAQMQTWAIRMWLLLDQTSADRHWQVWVAAWPLVVLAVVAGRAGSLAFEVMPEGGHAAIPGSRRAGASRWTIALAALVWVVSIIVPAVLFGAFVPGWGALRTFLRVHHEPLVSSLALGGTMAVVGAGLAAAAWFGCAAGRGPRRLVSVCLGALLVAGLLPGVLVGSAVAMAWNGWSWMRWVAESPGIVVLGLTARFGFLPMLIGVLLARAESASERDSRAIDGALGLKGWMSACLPAGVGTVAAAGIGAGILGFHEIEAAVILQPAGVDGLPRQMLGFLHFARTQELCAGALLTVGVGALGAVLAVACDRLAGVRWR
jgi:ABC-type Fe3+ transport system permease subunit